MARSIFCGSHFFWSKAFPLYGRDYDSVLEAIEKMEKNLPGFFYAGNNLSTERCKFLMRSFHNPLYYNSMVLIQRRNLKVD